MNSNSIIVQEYLSSLKEDKELDYLFPKLLNLMGYRIVQTAKESKGQSQYGKDIVAVGKDDKGKLYRWYFELKGYADKDISDKNYSVPDGIRESIIEAKDTAFSDSTIVGFNSLPIKIVLVHNGVLKTNIRPTFEGFISREFKSEEFERWDIYHLTNLFSQFLFSEYLLSDEQSNRLLKKSLVFLDVSDYNYSDFKELVNLQFEKVDEIKGRAFTKLFATLAILQTIIFHYSQENNNLVPAKECSKYLILHTWAWVLRKKLENKERIKKEMRNLLEIQFLIFKKFFQKTYSIARIKNGLYFERSGLYEEVGYPLRCFNYLDDAIYFCRLLNFRLSNQFIRLKIFNKQKDLLIDLIENNSGFFRPILDNHSIPIMQLFLFFANENLREKDVNFISSYIFKVINRVCLNKLKYSVFPDLYSRIDLTVEAVATKDKPEDYVDKSSILVAVLLELTAVFNSKEMFEELLKFTDSDLSLQIPNINHKDYDFEQLLFERNLHDEYHVESIDKLPMSFKPLKDELDFELFKESILKKRKSLIEYKTDKNGFGFLRYLAHSFYKNEILPEEWRIYIK